MHKANDPARLCRVACFWGDIYTGTKAQLNAAGFGVGCLFPGEPGGNKWRCTIPVAHGYAKVEVRLERMHRRELNKPFEDRVFDVSAHFLASDAGRYDPPIACAPGIVLEHAPFWDTYTGTADALIQAYIIQAHQLPGMPGCGKHTTTFDAEGNILKRGCAVWNQPGRVSVMKKGAKIRVDFSVSEEESILREARYRHNEKGYELRCLQAKGEKDARQAALRPRPALRLVWSV